jgi:hypothetical protein
MIVSPSLLINEEKLLLFLFLLLVRGFETFLVAFFDSFLVLEAGRVLVELVIGTAEEGIMCFDFWVQASLGVSPRRAG